MKNGRVFLLILLGASFLLGSVTNASAWRRDRAKTSVLKIGYFGPRDAKNGFIFGVNMGNSVDELVDLGFGVDIFHRSYRKDSQIAETISPGGVVEHTVVRELDFSTTAIPVMGTVTIKLSGAMPFTYFVGGGLGYEFLWNRETNYVAGASEKRFYHGFAWRAEGGILYQLGSRSSLIGEVFYMGANPKRNREKTAQGLPVWQEVNMSGFGFRIGLRIGGY